MASTLTDRLAVMDIQPSPFPPATFTAMSRSGENLADDGVGDGGAFASRITAVIWEGGLRLWRACVRGDGFARDTSRSFGGDTPSAISLCGDISRNNQGLLIADFPSISFQVQNLLTA